ncbi:MAG TPA: acylphosphatase [Nocardioides sp.]|uniref:acylphosphatase n=1 Tax=Nocardioides sp. TaxID=35761 RepID=UPI002E31F0E3|nr:acylphosphatase [Nocardioides sp.]HEX5086271.1 acylphosphatase [Nocardioides sp.]
MRAVEVRVGGRVQGVSFRWYAAREADRLGVAGWVRNEPDGTLTAHLEGPDDAVAELVEWLRHGPPAARVDRVELEDAAETGATSFRIAY